MEKLAEIFDVHITHVEDAEEEVSHVDESQALFSLVEVKSFTGTDEEFLHSVIRTFIENSDQGILDMKNALLNESDFYHTVSERAHKLLTGFRQFKIQQGVDKLTILERTRDRKLAKKMVLQKVEEMELFWKEVRQALEQYLQ